jgi:hypothetical protein
MLEVIELEDREGEEHDDTENDEAVSLMSGLTNQSSAGFLRFIHPPHQKQLTAFASPYGKMLNTMQASATLRRRESLGRAAYYMMVVGAMLVVVVLLWVVAQHHYVDRNDPTMIPHVACNGGSTTNHHDAVTTELPPSCQQVPPPPEPPASAPTVAVSKTNQTTPTAVVATPTPTTTAVVATTTPTPTTTTTPPPPSTATPMTTIAAATSSSSESADQVVNIIITVQLSGELGNHLSKLASGVGVALSLRDDYNMSNVQLRLRHQDHTDKWQNPVQDLHRCFPFARNLDFSEAQDDEDGHYDQKQHRYDGINSDNATVVRAAIRQIAQDAKSLASSSTSALASSPSSAPPSPLTISVRSDHLSILDYYMDRYYDVYRDYFAMDGAWCCDDANELDNDIWPQPDEVVLHFRLFTHEMPKKGYSMGYEELSPYDLVSQALNASFPGNVIMTGGFHNGRRHGSNSQTKKIALVSRYPDRLDAYVAALQDDHWSVRVIGNNNRTTTMSDFCFLRRAQYRLVGTVRSTFFWWAAVLSNASSSSTYNETTTKTASSSYDGGVVPVYAYSIDSLAKRAWAVSHGNVSVLETYPFTNPAITARFHFPLYTATTNTTTANDGDCRNSTHTTATATNEPTSIVDNKNGNDEGEI